MLTEVQSVSWQALVGVILVAVLVAGAYSDLRWRRLPNWLTLGAAGLGLALGLATRGVAGARDSVLGWLLGCALLFLPFALGAVGAGDVKLVGAIGALKGASFLMVSVLYMALAGGAMALALLILRGQLVPLLRKACGGLWLLVRAVAVYRMLPPAGSLTLGLTSPSAGASSGATTGQRGLTLPYGVAIAAGGLLALALGY